MTDWRAWIEAGNRLAQDPEARVPCPVCSDAMLEVLDVPLPDGRGVERHLRCPACGASNSLLIRDPSTRGPTGPGSGGGVSEE